MTASPQPTAFDQAVETLQAIMGTMPNDSHLVGPRGVEGRSSVLYMATLTAVAEGLVAPVPGHKWSSEDRRTGLAALGAFLSMLQAADPETGAYLSFQKPWLAPFVHTLLELKAK